MKRILGKAVRGVGSVVASALRTMAIAATIAGTFAIGAAIANYGMTAGSGLTFGSVVVGGFHYAQQFICDLTTPAQCASVSAGGALKVDGSAATQPVSLSGVSTAANQSTANTALAAIQTSAATTATNSALAIPTIQSGGVTALISCDNHVTASITSATDTLLVQGVTAKTIYICGWRARAAGVATWYLENTASTNANCSSTLTRLTGTATEAANTGEVMNPALWSGLKNTAGNGLCAKSTGTGGVDVDIFYAQF